jgi:hypothetical protein
MQVMQRLYFSQVQGASLVCQTQLWNFTLGQTYTYVVEIDRRSGSGQYRIELYDSSNTLITTTQSNVDGRGILAVRSGVGNYTLRVVPLTAAGDWAYSIALWIGMPSLSFAYGQSSYSSHTSLEGQANITTWRYVLNSGQSYHIEVARTDGTLEYSLRVLNAAKQQIASTRSSNGSVSIDLVTGVGTYYAEVTALDGTTGSYRISLVP